MTIRATRSDGSESRSDRLTFAANARDGAQHFYRAYGLVIASELELDELDRTEPAIPDLTIRLRPVEPIDADQTVTAFRFSDDHQHLFWPAVGRFLIRGTSEIDIDPSADIDGRLIAFPLLGPVLALLLHRRGLLVLHASAVAIGGRSAVFMGDKGAGKSTTAGAMIRAGHRLLTDDVVALDLSDPRRPMIVPGFPQLKLAADAASELSLGQTEVRPRVHPAIDKAQHRLHDGFSRDRVPATRIYILERGEKAGISPLPGIAALPAIIKFSYVTRFGRSALAGDFAALHLRQCAQLADHVGVCRLEVPTGLGRIGEALDLIEKDLSSDA
ncbi:serine kinase [Mesorhizobium sp. INR15]|uniref:serine kinase n=1 Tax=Mesorhizobium sp. INR15 TaxID=2654248 RepID=UPI001896773E|nr:serine kinase [Mesorhizobium sp. INR15]